MRIPVTSRIETIYLAYSLNYLTQIMGYSDG